MAHADDIRHKDRCILDGGKEWCKAMQYFQKMDCVQTSQAGKSRRLCWEDVHRFKPLPGGHQRRQRRIMSLHLRLPKLSPLYYPMSAFAVVDVIWYTARVTRGEWAVGIVMNSLCIYNVCTAQAKRLKKHQEMISKHLKTSWTCLTSKIQTLATLYSIGWQWRKMFCFV